MDAKSKRKHYPKVLIETKKIVRPRRSGQGCSTAPAGLTQKFQLMPAFARGTFGKAGTAGVTLPTLFAQAAAEPG